MGKLLDRLAAGPVICAEGYVFEFERRGYLQAGAFVPEVVLEEPDMVAGLHREYVHAGSDVVEAFTYYAHREKLAVIGREGDLERLNRQALRIAKQVGAEHDSLVAGNICNTNVYDPDDPTTHEAVRDMFAEQVGWAAEAGVDFVIAETIDYPGEALLAFGPDAETTVSLLVALEEAAEAELRTAVLGRLSAPPRTLHIWGMAAGERCAMVAAYPGTRGDDHVDAYARAGPAGAAAANATGQRPAPAG